MARKAVGHRAKLVTDSLQHRIDSWNNVLTGLGRALRDKRMSTEFSTIPTLTYTELDNLYQGDWIIARACDRPAAEMTRKWIEIKAKDDQDKASEVLAAVNKLGAKPAFKLANTWARLHGGALVVMGIDDGLEMSEPVNEEAVRRIEYLRVLDRQDVSVEGRYSSLDNTPGMVGEPSSYRINTAITDPAGGVVNSVVHASRCLRFDGMDTPLRLRIQNDMWNYGIVHRVYPIVRDFANAWGGAAHLMTDFAQAVMRIKDLAKMLAEDKDQVIIQRLQLLDMARSVARLVPIDEDEEFERKATPIAGLPDLLDRFGEQVAGALDMPVSVLFGKATPGIGDTGNSQLQQWYDKIANEQETRIVPQATRLARLVFLSREGPAKGREPATWSVDPLQLWEMSDKETAELRKSQAETDAAMIREGVVTPTEIRKSRFGGDEYTLTTTLDEDVSNMLDGSVEADLAAAGEPALDTPPQPEPTEAEPQKTAMSGGQIQALAGVLTAYNKKELTREQAASVIEVGFLVEKPAALALVGEREEKPQPPALPPGQPPPHPPQPGQQSVDIPQPDDGRRELEEDALRYDYVRKVGRKWIVYSKSGEKLGEHDTKVEADKQLAAIEAAKHRRG